jgi:hypothetical protein
MALIYIFEGDVLHEDHWCAKLLVSEEQLKDLQAKGLFRRHETGALELRFVGLLIFQQSAVVSFPKYALNREIDLPHLIAVLRRYFSRSAERTPITDALRDANFSSPEALREYDSMERLDAWFKTNGIYRREQVFISASGKIHWGRTIARQQPLIMQGSIVYPSHVSSKREGVFNEVSAIQLGVTAQLLHRYSRPVPDPLRHAVISSSTPIVNWPLPASSASYFLRKIDAERRVTFRTDSLDLFGALRGALLDATVGRSSRPQIFGTTAFYSVWEDACRSFFEEQATFVSVACPTWLIPTENGVDQYEHDQVPDFVFTGKGHLYVGDAKYYFPFPRSRPGSPDIVKQLFYAESIVCDKPIRSVFFLPDPRACIASFKGVANIQGSAKLFQFVEAWGLNTSMVFDAYLNQLSGRALNTISLLDRSEFYVTELLAQTPSLISRKTH